MVTVFENGRVIADHSFKDVRARADRARL